MRSFQHYLYRLGYIQSRLESWATSGHLLGMEYRYPLLDKRIVEFALGVPTRFFNTEATPRLLFYRVVKDYLPGEVEYWKKLAEIDRVLKLTDMEIEALKKWRNQSPELNQVCVRSPFINQGRVFDLVDGMQSEIGSSCYYQIYRVDTAIKSILALKL